MDLVNGTDHGTRNGGEGILEQHCIFRGLDGLCKSTRTCQRGRRNVAARISRAGELTFRFHRTSPAPAAPSFAPTSSPIFLAPPRPPTKCPYARSFLDTLPSSSRPTRAFSKRLGPTPHDLATCASDLGPAYRVSAAFVTRVGRFGNDDKRSSVVRVPRSELPTWARVAFEAWIGVVEGESGRMAS